MLDSHPIHQYYTDPQFCNVLQILKEKSIKLEGTTLPRRRNIFTEAKKFAKAKGSFANAKQNDSKRRATSSPKRT